MSDSIRCRYVLSTVAGPHDLKISGLPPISKFRISAVMVLVSNLHAFECNISEKVCHREYVLKTKLMKFDKVARKSVGLYYRVMLET